MPGFHQRFVGLTELPRSIPQFDIDESFQLSQHDIDEVRYQFKAARLGAALQLVVIRATGRSPNKFTGIPRTLLRSLCLSLKLSDTAIASMKTLYARPATRFAHQKWAREQSGLAPVGDAVMTDLRQALAQLAKTAASADELTREAELWLFVRKHLLPGDRVLRDAARAAFAAYEIAALAVVRDEIPAPALKKAITAVFAKRKGRGGGTVLEWLRIAPGKHSPTGLHAMTKKVAFLKELSVDRWSLAGITNARMRAYSQAVIGRPPFDTQRLSDDTKVLEIACFLRATLLELTDNAVYMAGRRCCDLVRSAASRIQGKQSRHACELREEREQMRAVLYADGKTDAQKVTELKALITLDGAAPLMTGAALVREGLTEDASRVTALLHSLAGFHIDGDASQRALQQIRALRDFKARGVSELPPDFDRSIADPVWHELLGQADRKKALAALRACAMTSVRKGLRSGRLWIDHSWGHRNREDLLISPDVWKDERAALIRALSLTSDPKQYLERVFAALRTCLDELSLAARVGTVEIDSAGHVRLPAIQALEVDREATRSRDAMFAIIGEVQFGDILVELDAHVGFSEALLGKRASSSEELTALYGALLAHGTENDAKGVAAMDPRSGDLAHLGGDAVAGRSRPTAPCERPARRVSAPACDRHALGPR